MRYRRAAAFNSKLLAHSFIHSFFNKRRHRTKLGGAPKAMAFHGNHQRHSHPAKSALRPKRCLSVASTSQQCLVGGPRDARSPVQWLVFVPKGYLELGHAATSSGPVRTASIPRPKRPCYCQRPLPLSRVYPHSSEEHGAATVLALCNSHSIRHPVLTDKAAPTSFAALLVDSAPW